MYQEAIVEEAESYKGEDEGSYPNTEWRAWYRPGESERAEERARGVAAAAGDGGGDGGAGGGAGDIGLLVEGTAGGGKRREGEAGGEEAAEAGRGSVKSMLEAQHLCRFNRAESCGDGGLWRSMIDGK